MAARGNVRFGVGCHFSRWYVIGFDAKGACFASGLKEAEFG